MTFANKLDLDKAPQNVEPHIISKLFDTKIAYMYQQFVYETTKFCKFEKKKKERKMLKMKRAKENVEKLKIENHISKSMQQTR